MDRRASALPAGTNAIDELARSGAKFPDPSVLQERKASSRGSVCGKGIK
jgi:hypothetical protein